MGARDENGNTSRDLISPGTQSKTTTTTTTKTKKSNYNTGCIYISIYVRRERGEKELRIFPQEYRVARKTDRLAGIAGCGARGIAAPLPLEAEMRTRAAVGGHRGQNKPLVGKLFFRRLCSLSFSFFFLYFISSFRLPIVYLVPETRSARRAFEVSARKSRIAGQRILSRGHRPAFSCLLFISTRRLVLNGSLPREPRARRL